MMTARVEERASITIIIIWLEAVDGSLSPSIAAAPLEKEEDDDGGGDGGKGGGMNGRG